MTRERIQKGEEQGEGTGEVKREKGRGTKSRYHNAVFYCEERERGESDVPHPQMPLRSGLLMLIHPPCPAYMVILIP